jgi:hypothetical protein
MTSAPRHALDWLLLAVIDLTVPAVIAWKHRAGDTTSTVALLTGFISIAVLNAVIVGAISSRRRRLGEGSSRGFLSVAIGLAVLSGLLTALGVLSFPERNDYVELALSNVPLEEIHPEQKALVVELVRRRAADSKNYERVAAQIKPISPPLFSPDSFANDAVIRAVLEQYTKAYTVDFDYREEEQRTMSDFRDKMMKVDPDYLKTFEAAEQAPESQESGEEKAFQLQKASVAATLALYNYADTHTKEISLRNGELRFANAGVQAEFSRQLEDSKSRHERWQELLHELVKEHQRSRAQLGLAPNS